MTLSMLDTNHDMYETYAYLLLGLSVCLKAIMFYFIVNQPSSLTLSDLGVTAVF